MVVNIGNPNNLKARCLADIFEQLDPRYLYCNNLYNVAASKRVCVFYSHNLDRFDGRHTENRH